MRLVVEETVGQVTEVEKLTTILQIADFDAGLRMMLEAEQSQTTQASGDITLTDSSKTIQFIDPNGADRIVNLPSTSINNHGFVIVNSGSSYSLTVKSGSTTLGTVQADGGIGWFLSNGTEWIKAGGGSTSVVIEEQDGTPSITIGTLKVPNGQLTDEGGGVASLITGIGSTYTPTFTGVLNITSATAYNAMYIRIGNIIMVSGYGLVRPSASSSQVTLGISLPVASNFANVHECAGVGKITTTLEPAAVYADTTNDRATIDWKVTGTTSEQPFTYQFMYRVI